MRWIRVRTGQKGWSMQRLMYRGKEIGRVERFSYGVYGNVFGERTGCLTGDLRRAKTYVRKQCVKMLAESGLGRFLQDTE